MSGDGGQPDRRLWDAAVAYFVADDWPLRPHPDEGIIETAFKGEQGKWPCVARVVHDLNRFVFYSLGPMDATADKVTALNELLTRASFGLIIGNFELNVDTGSFRYKTSIDATEAIPTHAVLQSLVLTNVLTMDRYLPAVQRLLYADATAEQALAEVEG